LKGTIFFAEPSPIAKQQSPCGATKEKIEQFLSSLSSGLDFYSQSYDNFMVIGDFNLEPDNQILKNFMDAHDLYNLVKDIKPVTSQKTVPVLTWF